MSIHCITKNSKTKEVCKTCSFCSFQWQMLKALNQMLDKYILLQDSMNNFQLKEMCSSDFSSVSHVIKIKYLALD